MNGKGPNPSRQDAPHPHEVVVDPTGAFLLAPDLGADMIRIWTINQSNGQLTSCPSLNVTGGTGPRHAAFWAPSNSSTRMRRAAAPTGLMMYVSNELANTVSAFSVSYPSSGCMSFTQTQSLHPYPNNAAAVSGTKVGEVHVAGNFVYNTNRRDGYFSGNDSIATWSLSSTGTMTFVGLANTYGTYPRTFQINKAGTYVAIGDQTTSNVAILTRDPSTGKLGDLVANLRIGRTGTPENEDGLSSVVWAE
jgi:6-phosphogluconolactonase (cycloisomerase 2 family)